MQKTILTLLTFIFLPFLGTCEEKYSVTPVGAIRHQNLVMDNPSYGTGVDLGVKLNAWVSGHVRALGYQDPDNWRGGAVDEGSLLINARLLTSQSKKLSLSAVGSINRDFQASDWGFGVGPEASVRLPFKLNLDLVGSVQLRSWFKQEKDLYSTLGLRLNF